MPGLFSRGLPNPATGRALLTGIPRVNHLNADAKLLGFVGENVSELGKAPVREFTVHVPALVALYLSKVFENDNVNVIAPTQNRLDGTSEDISPEAVLTSAKSSEPLSGRRCAFGLELSSPLSHLSGTEIQLRCGEETIITCHCNVSDSLVNAKGAAPSSLRGSIFGDRNLKEPTLLAADKFATAYLPSAIKELGLVVGEVVAKTNTLT